MHAIFRTLSFAPHLWPYYVGIVIASVLVALTGVAVPFVIAAATELMVGVVNGDTVNLQQPLLLAGLLFVFDAANTVIRNVGGYYGDIMASKLKSQLSYQYYRHLLSLPQSYYDDELTGTIINRLNRAITEVTNFLNIFANNFLQMLLTTFISLGVILFYSVELAIMVAIIYPLFMWLTAITSRTWQGYQEKKNAQTDIASGRFAEVVTQMKVVKSYTQETLELRHFKRHYDSYISDTYKQSRYWHKMDIVRGGVLAVIFFGIFAFIFASTASGRFSVAEMVLLITLINALRLPIFSMSFIVDNFQRAKSGSKDFVAAMEIKAAIANEPGARTVDFSEASITYNRVHFGYNVKKPILKNISFTVNAGEKVALVGESGEGKTTITNLLMRLYDTTDGEITINNQSIKKLTLKSLRKHIATVFQEPALFSGTIRENIAYSHASATHEQVEESARAANAHDFISKLPNGYDTEIGERGMKLSGGQKQRIAIARAILKDAPILVLDEATSSLDSRSEHLVQEALDRLMHGRTTLIIAHRLSTIAEVDKIVTLKNGTVDEIGTPEELAQSDGLYQRLLELQSAGTTTRTKKALKRFEISS
ncbi:ABC transporter ATP-binding protein [Candidatus Saccharibacteria bacterium]|nr:ABC transporter ATP-binding protein [Candidatus Saccharibacteria bacterium]